MTANKIGAGEALQYLSGWAVGDELRDTITKTYHFADFKQAFAFMTGAALKAEQMDHHPEWANVYSRVQVTLTTHDADGVTDKDVELARFMDRLAAKLA